MFEGIVLKVTKEYSIVKTKTEYLRVRTNQSLEPGQRIHFTSEEILHAPVRKRKPAPYLLRYGTAAALALFLLSSPLLEKKNAYAAKILVEVNPSVLLEISSSGLVEKALPYNDDAKHLPLEEYKNLPAADAIEEILEDAEKEGYLNLQDEEEDFIILTEILSEEERFSEELFQLLEEKALISDTLQDANLLFTTASEEHLKEMRNQGKALGLMRLREEFNLGPEEKLGDFFKDPERREAYKEEKRLLKRNTLEEDESLVADLSEETSQAFKEQLLIFKASILEVKEARKAYQEARKSGDEKAMEEALQDLRAAEEKKAEMEELKDQLEQAKEEEENAASPETPGSNGNTTGQPDTSGNNGNTPVKPETPGNNGNTPVKPETPGNNGNTPVKPETPGNNGKNPEETPNSTGSPEVPNEGNDPDKPDKGKPAETPSSENNGKKPAKDAPGQKK